MKKITCFLRSLTVLLVTLAGSHTTAAKPAILNYTILETRPHAEYSFTQGLDLVGSTMYESSGLYKKSFIRAYDIQTNKVISQKKLPRKIFAEGLCEWDGKIHMLTWKAGILYVYDASTLDKKNERQYQGEGWGLTHNNREFIMSNGSTSLFFRDKNSFKITRELHVQFSGKGSGPRLNELEYANGKIWANAWHQNRIYKIDPQSGKVVGILDLSAIVKHHHQRIGETVLNGIAYDDTRDAFWITGKLWDTQYLIQVD